MLHPIQKEYLLKQGVPLPLGEDLVDELLHLGDAHLRVHAARGHSSDRPRLQVAHAAFGFVFRPRRVLGHQIPPLASGESPQTEHGNLVGHLLTESFDPLGESRLLLARAGHRAPSRAGADLLQLPFEVLELALQVTRQTQGY